MSELEVDRDTYCTPPWIARALGPWDLDPCSNERSYIDAARTFSLEQGQSGLALARFISRNTRTFLNPPYSDVGPWVRAYCHTRFCFLVKFDPSTKWCGELIAHTELVLFPKATRIAFDPPPGIEKPDGNQFPHGFFFSREDDATAAIRGLCFAWRTVR
jgi:hypothetical protein